MVTNSVKEARKALAREHIQKEWERGRKLEGIGDTEAILAEHAKTLGARNFFDCLSERDLRDIYRYARNSKRRRPRPPANNIVPPSINANPGPTPLPTPPQLSEEDERSEGHGESDLGMENIHDEAIREEESPIIGESDVSDPKCTFDQQPAKYHFHQ